MCASEVSDIEQNLWQEYQALGVQVWGIGPDDPLEYLADFAGEMGLTFPILFDEGGTVHAQYNAGGSVTNSIYPQDWIVGVDGTVVYMSRSYEPEAMQAVLDAELAKAR